MFCSVQIFKRDCMIIAQNGNLLLSLCIFKTDIKVFQLSWKRQNRIFGLRGQGLGTGAAINGRQKQVGERNNCAEFSCQELDTAITQVIVCMGEGNYQYILLLLLILEGTICRHCSLYMSLLQLGSMFLLGIGSIQSHSCKILHHRSLKNKVSLRNR